MRKSLFLITFFLSHTLFAQFHIGAFVGVSNYLGDLTDQPYKRCKPAIGISLNYELSDRFMIRSGITLAGVEGADMYGTNQAHKITRNLSFHSAIQEFELAGELTAFNLYNIRWSPYIFGGVALYHFNPYTYDALGNKVYLRPLSTEGEGLQEYPGRKNYSTTQFAIPFGGGIKYAINDDVRIGFEIGIRKLFTDYLDDVSTTYADEQVLLTEKGPEAVAIAYRADEYPGGSQTYPSKGDIRGNPKTQDWYYFTGIHLTFRIGDGHGKTFASGLRKGYGCPTHF